LGRWGETTERTLNFIAPELGRRAASSIKSGRVSELSIPIGLGGPPWNWPIKRADAIHLMSYLPLLGETENAIIARRVHDL